MMQDPANYAIFPVINATLNGTSAVLLVVGVLCLLLLLKQLRSFVAEPEPAHKPGTESAAFIGH